MSPENGPSRLESPWPFITLALIVAAVVIGFALGFLILPRYQEAGRTVSMKDAIYLALGLHTHGKSFNTIQPPLRVPVIEQALETAGLMLGTDKSRGYCLEMICADFLAGADLENRDPQAITVSLRRLIKFLPQECRNQFLSEIKEGA
jgi:hypothetical protein